MTQGFEIKGWCPGALRPMESGDGLILRLRVPLGRLSPTQIAGVARVSKRFGNGLIDLSARGNMQLRGLRPDTHGATLDALRALGLIDPDAETEARRNITTTPFWQDGDLTHRVATQLAQALAQTPLPLPGKFGFAVDCGPEPVLRDTAADIRIERGPDGLLVRPDSAMTGTPATANSAARSAIELAQWFLQSGGAPTGRGRMAQHLTRHTPPPEFAQARTAERGACLPPPGPVPGGMLLALPFGRMGADTLAGLADAPLTLTPWRMVLTQSDTRPKELIATPDDPRLQVWACPGAPECPQALAPTRDFATAIAPHMAANLHVSGCAKGCAHPGSAKVTLTATDAGWRVIRNGRAGDDAPRTLDESAIMADPAILTGDL